MTELELLYTDDYATACAHRDAGAEPIECAFGGFGSVLGPLAMDHHGTESHREGVAIRAVHHAFGARRADPRFVVTGSPDADATLAIVALAGLVEPDEVPAGFAELVDRHDTSPIGLDLTEVELGARLLAFNQTTLPKGAPGFRAGVDRMIAVLRSGLAEGELRQVLGKERSRRAQAHKALVAVYAPGGFEQPLAAVEPHPTAPPVGVALATGTGWGFDVWYTWAPVVVSYSHRLEKVTFGCRDVATAERLFGEGGLLQVYPRFGVGWGGREAVGGSPRGVPMAPSDARMAAQKLAEMLGAAA